MAHSCHILVEGNPAIIYASRRGTPEKMLPILKPFLEKFWEERETSGEYNDTPDCLVAQIVVRLGFEFCEDDFSNLRVGSKFNGDVGYLYQVAADRSLSVWMATEAYHQQPQLGLQGCQRWTGA
ncbi:histidine kinase [Pantanalinema rosaneae CENA516]|uniref:histidine kinase n=1 Tax=Pantanalinema rosaneae TaxID=1620701 RepID=UPI003D6F19BD